MKKITQLAIVKSLLLILLLPFSVFAGDWNTNKNGVVLDGYDIVSYRIDDKAIRGSSKLAAKYDNVRFYFATKEHRDMFIKNPKQYLPKYNGYCAFAAGAQNAKVPANADTFKMYNGELLMFFNDMYKGNKFNTKVPWNGNEKKLFVQAEKNWVKLK
jgi:YHS domain-containing protein